MDTEIWLPIFGYALTYEASSKGRIRRIRTGYVLKPIRLGETGRFVVNLSQRGSYKTCLITSLIAAAFLGPRPANTNVRPLDGDWSNSAVSNLRYVSRKVEIT